MILEIDFLPVGNGNGDAICVRYGDDQRGYTVHIVDGAFKECSADIISHVTSHYHGASTIVAHMVVSHACNDHVPGLIDVIKALDVRNVWMNRPWMHTDEVMQAYPRFTTPGLYKRMRDKHEYLVELEEIAARRGIPIHDAFQGAQIGNFLVLAPSRQRYISLIPHLDKTPDTHLQPAPSPFTALPNRFSNAVRETWERETLAENVETSPSNETSVVQLGNFDGHRALLTADVGPIGLSEAAIYAMQRGILMPPDFVQVPHHGSRHNVTPMILDVWLGKRLPDETSPRRGVAFCSVGADADLYPRKKVSNAFLRRGYPVHATRGKVKGHYHGRDRRSDWGASSAEPFSLTVEDND